MTRAGLERDPRLALHTLDRRVAYAWVGRSVGPGGGTADSGLRFDLAIPDNDS